MAWLTKFKLWLSHIIFWDCGIWSKKDCTYYETIISHDEPINNKFTPSIYQTISILSSTTANMDRWKPNWPMCDAGHGAPVYGVLVIFNAYPFMFQIKLGLALILDLQCKKCCFLRQCCASYEFWISMLEFTLNKRMLIDKSSTRCTVYGEC